MIDADGTLLGRTRMIHITDYPCFHEQGYYTPGDTGAPVYGPGPGAIGVAICYDRHYPEYMRALALGGADLVVVPQAGAVGEWPEGLYEAEMRVAAFQNGYFVALCNRVGAEECLTFAGESFVCAPDGRVVARARPTDRGESSTPTSIVAEAASSHARRLFLRHRRPELYPGWLGPALTRHPLRLPCDTEPVTRWFPVLSAVLAGRARMRLPQHRRRHQQLRDARRGPGGRGDLGRLHPGRAAAEHARHPGGPRPGSAAGG